MIGIRKGDLTTTFQGKKTTDMFYVFGSENVVEVMCRGKNDSKILVYKRCNPSPKEVRGYHIDLEGIKPRIITNSKNKREFHIRNEMLLKFERGEI